MDVILYGLGKGRKLVEQRFITVDKLCRYKFDYLILCIDAKVLDDGTGA